MQRQGSAILYSASDLVNFLDCEHITTLDRMDLDTPMPKSPVDDQAALIQAKGATHEALYLAVLEAEGREIVKITETPGGFSEKAETTRAAMRVGAEIIYQAHLADGEFIGIADILRRVPVPSALGPYSYEAVDTKLARRATTRALVQLSCYSALLAKAQGVEPNEMHLVLGDGREERFRVAEYAHYVRAQRERFLEHVANPRAMTYPEPCLACDTCRWQERCQEQWKRDDHLSLVADIRKNQIEKLEAAGVHTLEALAILQPGTRLPKIEPGTLEKLRQQAALQLKARKHGGQHYELLPLDPEGQRGLANLPTPNDGDLFFDMEGNPLEEGGLEYLFGVYYFEGIQPKFRAFWAHNRTEEKHAFEQFMDFVIENWRRHPGAHIYHYAPYEVIALKKLMSLHATREAEVDSLLRANRFVDLYKIVRHSLRISEPGYSLKNIEHFYLKKRTAEVKTAGASIVYYERWKDTGDNRILKEIERYNYEDVFSLRHLHQWLLSLRPPELPWRPVGGPSDDGGKAPAAGEPSAADKRLVPYRQKLVDNLPSDRAVWTACHHLHELVYQLLDFHRRAEKPLWWEVFTFREMSEEELFDEPDCLAGLTLDPAHPPKPDKRSIIYTYRYPAQETRLKSGDRCRRTDTLEKLGEAEIDEEAQRVRLRRSAAREALPERLHIALDSHVPSDVLRAALFRYADSLIASGSRYHALQSVLRRELPRIRGRESGRPIIDEKKPLGPQVQSAIENLDNSHLVIQGPPGTGKTRIASEVIVELLRAGKRIGISSNSHHAINHLLAKVEELAVGRGVIFRGVKKSSTSDTGGELGGKRIDVTPSKDAILGGNYQLIAGTAWLFADPAFDETLDYLFVDEAGQVALANLVAMGTSARNIILIGDPMQLGQPVQGTHPGHSGESSLEYMLADAATVAPERGIFLNTSYRLHPDICRVVSEMAYECRLLPDPKNVNQTLVLNADAHPALQPTGVSYSSIEHHGCAQQSQEEAERMLAIYQSLLRQQYKPKDGSGPLPLGKKNILVVAPYNMQVNLLKKMLPEGARVGTVDKFQGQEAEVVILSMTTSSGDDLPRDIEFLYSKNRLNVALSRARCLAVVVASLALKTSHCTRPEEIAQVNTFCQIAPAEREANCCVGYEELKAE